MVNVSWYICCVEFYIKGMFKDDFGESGTDNRTGNPTEDSILAIQEELAIIKEDNIEIVIDDPLSTSEASNNLTGG